MREARGEVAAKLTQSVDAALLRALADVAGIHAPALSPVRYGEVQLTVGCSDESSACLSEIARVAGADALVVRHLIADARGAVLLRLLYFEESGGQPPAQVQMVALNARPQEFPEAMPRLVRELLGIRETSAASSPPSTAGVDAPPDSSSDDAGDTEDDAAQLTEDHDGAISTLTWTVLAVGTSALVAGIALALSADADYDELQRTRVGTREQAERAQDDFAAIETRATFANVLIPVGAVALGLGATLLVLDLSSGEPGEAAPSARLHVTPLAGGGALSLRGTFDGAR